MRDTKKEKKLQNYRFGYKNNKQSHNLYESLYSKKYIITINIKIHCYFKFVSHPLYSHLLRKNNKERKKKKYQQNKYVKLSSFFEYFALVKRYCRGNNNK